MSVRSQSDQSPRIAGICPLLPWIVFISMTAVCEAGFTDVTQAAGLLYDQSGSTPPLSETNELLYFGSGLAVADYDGDGWLDLFYARFDARDLLFHNNGNGTFSEVSVAAGLTGVFYTNGAAWGDIDNDGDPDLYVSTLRNRRFFLYINNGDGTFTENAVERNVDLTASIDHQGTSITFGDYDRDGWLDAHTNEWTLRLESTAVDKHSVLLRNRGKQTPGHFENTTLAANVAIRNSGEVQFGFTSVLTDFDRDGWPDLGIASDFGTSRLFWNLGDGRFQEDLAIRSSLSGKLNGMGVAVGDVDHDGFPDWFISAISPKGYSAGAETVFDGNRLLLNRGDRTFADATDAAGVRHGGWGWGTTFFDYDNDGDLDLALTNGSARVARVEDRVDSTTLWRNDAGSYIDVSASEGISDNRSGSAMVAFDYDNDGDLDLCLTNSLSTPILYRNDLDPGSSWLRIRLKGTVSNSDGYGAVVTVSPGNGDLIQTTDYNPTNAFLSTSEPVIHLGLADHRGPVETVSVRWPSGIVQHFTSLAPNQTHVLVEALPLDASAPKLISAPQDAVIERGTTLVLTAGATGSPEPEWQWFHDGQIIPGHSRSTLRIEGVLPSDSGLYSVRAYNVIGEARSQSARIKIVLPVSDLSVARRWNEVLLDAIRGDFPAPTVHARNLFHTSIAMWDAWAAYDPVAIGYIYSGKHTADDLEAARRTTISYAAYRVLSARYALAVNPIESQALFDSLMEALGYDTSIEDLSGESPAAVGNRIGAAVLGYGLYDLANEDGAYADDSGYTPVNEPMIVRQPGTTMADPNRWQPLALDFLILQNGIPVGASIQKFVGPNWGGVKGFALNPGPDRAFPLDPGPPPFLGGATDARFKADALEVIRFSSLLDPTMPERGGKLIDIGPATNHHNTLGTRDGQGYPEGNPVSGEPYQPVMVKQADYGRVLAEFWADGPKSETPPGHWNVLANEISAHPNFRRRIAGEGVDLDPLEWDVKMYFALNGAVHDAAIAAWGAKAHYDFTRPISMIRYMGGLGQSSAPGGPAYHKDGLPLEPGLVEIITEASAAPGQRHERLADRIGSIAILAWLGNPPDPETGTGGVGWMLAEGWVPYQKATFVTPAFAAYVSGHSAFSRAAAEVLAGLTGTPYFPGGLGSFHFARNGFLEFERGPTEDVTLEWATYFDASDEAGISRLHGGIHIAADDLEGRKLGSIVGKAALAKASSYYDGSATAQPWRLGYSEWRSIRLGPDGSGNQPGDRPTGGLSHLEEFAFGLATDRMDSAGLPALTHARTTGAVSMHYTRPVEGTGITYLLERSLDLKQWESVPPAAQQVRWALGKKGLIDVTIDLASTDIDSGWPWFYRVTVTDDF